MFLLKGPAGGLHEATLREVMDVARTRLDVGKSYSGALDGRTIMDSRLRDKALARIRGVATHMGTGETLRVREDGADKVLLWVRAAAAEIDVIDINGNDNSDYYWTTIVKEFGEYDPRFAGSYVCKSVSGTSTPSQHSFGNAVDIFFDSIAHQELVAEWVVRHADELNVDHVISLKRIWTRGVGWHAYTGETHYHLHVDFTPQYSGSCGIRG